MNRLCIAFLLSVSLSLLTGCGKSEEVLQLEADVAELQQELEESKQSAETELVQAKTRLAEAKKELELVRVMLENATSEPKPKIKRPHADWTPKQLVKTYLAAESIDHKCLLVADPERVRTHIAHHYEHGIVPVTNVQIQPYTKTPTSFVVAAQYKDSPIRRDFVVMHTPAGYRIDWEASQLRWRAASEHAFAEAHGLVDAVIKIELLKATASGRSATLDFRFTNRSGTTIEKAAMGYEAYGVGNRFLSRGDVQLGRIGPNESTTASLFLPDVNLSDVTFSKFNIDNVEITTSSQRNVRAGRHFKLEYQKQSR